MTHADLYPCDRCGRNNLYPGPCASCEHFIHPPVKPHIGNMVPPAKPEPRRPVNGDDMLAVGRWIRGGRL